MTRTIFLDAGPLGLASHPGRSATVDDCRTWLTGLVRAGVRVIVPEVADYEVRRELIRAGKADGIARLDSLIDGLEYGPITTPAMRRAAELWAAARRAGRPTAAAAEALDGDVILAAPALTLGAAGVIVATTNVAHLGLYVSAAVWSDIT